MLRPSYSDLMEKLTEQGNIDQSIASRYTIVIAAAKRARQLIDSENVLIDFDRDKAVSESVKELYDGKIKITAGIKPPEIIRDKNIPDIEWEPYDDYS